MSKQTLLYIGILLALLLALGALYFFLSETKVEVAPVPDDSSSNVFVDAATPTTSPQTSVTPVSPPVQPPHTKLYTSSAYHFVLWYPEGLTVEERPVAGTSMVVLFKDAETARGFEIFVTPYAETKITDARFHMDESSGVMTDPVNITIDGAAATKFFSTNTAMGESREIWFLHGGYLYEVTAPKTLDRWLLGIMSTWQFE